MARHLPEIDRLIEQGLSLYGQGDLDGALRVWEKALAIDPDNAQANSYVDYVRMNYELLSNDVNGNVDSAPFGIGDGEPDYQIEILPGEVEPGTPAPLYIDPQDEGWMFEQEAGPSRASSPESGAMTLEIEADEPSDPGVPPPLSFDAPGTFEQGFDRANTFEAPGTFDPVGTDGGVSFEDATREYPGGKGRPDTDLIAQNKDKDKDFAAPEVGTSEFHPEATPGFGSPSDYHTPPGGFASQTTDVRKRDLGFVQAVQDAPASPTPAPERQRRGSAPPELKMTLRTPAAEAGFENNATPNTPDEPDLDTPTIARKAAPANDLISSLPIPRAAPKPAAVEPERPVQRVQTHPYGLPLDPSAPVELPRLRGDSLPPGPPGPPTPTRDLPSPSRPPATKAAARDAMAVAATQELPPLPAKSPTRDFSQQLTPSIEPSIEPKSITRDFEVATKRRPGVQFPPEPAADDDSPTRDNAPISRPDPLLVSAPTRDLGLRARTGTEDEPTAKINLDALKRTATGANANTRADIVLPFDPIDARTAQILEEVDQGVPDSEGREDRTRRRITALFEKASQYNAAGELDRAVAAVDLALSEDPNSALAQKLIHRNRETMMTVFQAFLGDLQRQPQLARPLHELAQAPISPRAAFLLSRVDGLLSLDEILDVSGMPRLEAYRHLCQLYLRGILR